MAGQSTIGQPRITTALTMVRMHRGGLSGGSWTEAVEAVAARIDCRPETNGQEEQAFNGKQQLEKRPEPERQPGGG